jgi:DNA-binding NtrC family response regulator
VRRLGGSKLFASDVRIVAATNRDLAAEVNRGNFRADLYYRLAVAKLAIPALRERREDLPLLVEHFLRQLSVSSGNPDPRLPEDFIARANRHPWPGNVRELRNAVERAVLLPNHPAVAIEAPMKKDGESFAAIDIDVPFKVAKQKLVDEFDRRYLKELLEAHDGNISAAARAAGIERMSIYKMIRRLGLDKDTSEGRAPTAPGDEDEDSSYSDAD